MPQPLSSVVILGASVSGLLAARILSRHADRVTLVERDRLSGEAGARKGVPQGGHAHGLLANGYRIIEGYFPGIMDELEARGATRGDMVDDFLWFQYGRWKLRHRSGLRGILLSRPCLEAAVRQRVLALPNLDVVAADGLGPVLDEAGGRVVGLRIRRPGAAPEVLDADLVVDASGRGSQTPAWLEEHGFGRPDEDAVRVDVGYATRLFARRKGELYDAFGAIIAGTPPADRRFGCAMAIEGDRWMITLSGIAGDHPPADVGGWTDFARSLAVPALHDLVTAAEPLSGVETCRFPANRRRRYDRMRRFPGGFLVVGDAVCSFNPIYGQGMTVAASEAEALDAALAEGLDGLHVRLSARARRIIDIPWSIATGEDLRYPEVVGRRPPGNGLLERYLERVHATAAADPVVCRRFFDVLNLLAPPAALLAPAIAWRVLGRRAPPGPGSPRPAAAAA
ncbi:FAD-dependent oxidoreductase [Methylobacterium oryzisoli]|uniref:FAD-dependent oxidoreductase n=1 Tax=Methylobacterium oryzisoli TaxID=3385502 RepID=UPI003891AFFB